MVFARFAWQKRQTINQKDINALMKRIVALLENGDLSSRLICSTLKCAEQDAKTALKLLLEHRIIDITQTNTYKLKGSF